MSAPKPVFLACCVTLAVSAAVITYGPEPLIRSTFVPADSQIEIRDRVWFAVWLTLPPLLVALCSAGPIRSLGRELTRLAWLPHALFAPLALYLLAVPAEISLSWNGFGLGPTLFSVIAAAVWIRYRTSRWLNALLEAGAWALLVRTALFVIESGERTVDVYHSQFTIDEMLSFSGGRAPLIDYIPQYTSLLGVVPVPLIRLLGMEPLRAAIFSIVALKLVTIGCLIWAQLRAFGSNLRWGQIAAVSLAALLCTHEGPLADRTISSYHAILPFRLLGPAMAYVALTNWLSKPLGGRARPFAVGLVLAGGALANIDFGMLGAIAAGSVFAARLWVSPKTHRATETLWFAIGSATFIALHLLAYLTAYRRIAHYEQLMVFPRMFGGSGLMNVSMPALGPHSLVAFVAAYATWRAWGAMQGDARRTQWGALMYLGIFTMGTLAYYTGRSLISTLTGGSAIPVALLLAGYGAVAWAPRSPDLAPSAPSAPWLAGRLAIALCRALPVAVLFAALFFQPRVWVAKGSGIPVTELPPELVRSLPEHTGLFANDGNLLSARSGIANTVSFSHTGYVRNPAGARVYCDQLAAGTHRHLLVQLQPNRSGWPDSDSGVAFVGLAHSPSCQAVGIDTTAVAAVDAARARGERWRLIDLRRAGW